MWDELIANEELLDMSKEVAGSTLQFTTTSFTRFSLHTTTYPALPELNLWLSQNGIPVETTAWDQPGSCVQVFINPPIIPHDYKNCILMSSQVGTGPHLPALQ